MKHVGPNRPRYADAAQVVEDMILSGELGVGDRVPELAAELGISRSTWREVLRMLDAWRLIDTQRGASGGSFVAAPSTAHLERFVRTYLTIAGAKDISASQVLEIRRIFEVPLAGFAAERRSEDTLVDLTRSLSVSPKEGEPREWHKNFHFHKVIVRATGNPLATALLNPLTEVLEIRWQKREALSSDRWAMVSDDHHRIYTAIVLGDADRARAEMGMHMDHLGEFYSELDDAI